VKGKIMMATESTEEHGKILIFTSCYINFSALDPLGVYVRHAVVLHLPEFCQATLLDFIFCYFRVLP
jgi:hypothetical protein